MFTFFRSYCVYKYCQKKKKEKKKKKGKKRRAKSLEGGLDDSELLKLGFTHDLARSTKNRASERYPVPPKKAVKEDKENVRPSAPNACRTLVKKTTYPSAQKSPLSPSRSVGSGLNKKLYPELSRITFENER